MERKEAKTLTDTLRVVFKDLLDGVGRIFLRMGVHPNTMTIGGLVFSAAGAWVVAQGRLVEGGLLILASGPFDALDGTLARLKGEPEEFGAFVDSVSDRYIELFIFAGLAWYFTSLQNTFGIMLCFAAAGGTVLVSYIRARAQGLGFDAKVGWFTRVERFLVLAPCILFGIPLIGVGIIALGANVTAVQRIIYVRRESRQRGAARDDT
ncbi:MAG: CDP-alcohol phosphatidyltransferase family protein [Anaerolineae bacterium]|nr:MAG: CDP-alcohol phosphatidyltransferase family protein [Anaerolineae bacterium]